MSEPPYVLRLEMSAQFLKRFRTVSMGRHLCEKVGGLIDEVAIAILDAVRDNRESIPLRLKVEGEDNDREEGNEKAQEETD